MAEGDAFAEENSHLRQEVVEGVVEAYVLHRVLYPQVHENGFKKKKKKKKKIWCRSTKSQTALLGNEIFCSTDRQASSVWSQVQLYIW
jgi:hypothetical protein